MLCNLLSQTGVAGAPNSFFRAQSMVDFARDWGVPAQTLANFDAGYISEAVKRGTAGTGCFGLRAMWDNIPDLLSRLRTISPDALSDQDLLADVFGPMKFIHLSRQDKVAQAVSLAMASQTGLWHRRADGTELERTQAHTDPVYDCDQIAAEHNEVTQGDIAWRRWFTANKIAPLSISYEGLAADPSGTLAQVLAFLHRDTQAASGIQPGTAKLASSTSDEWAARFRRDAGLAPAGGAP